MNAIGGGLWLLAAALLSERPQIASCRRLASCPLDGMRSSAHRMPVRPLQASVDLLHGTGRAHSQHGEGTATGDPAVSSYCDGQSIYECIDGLESEFLESCALSDHCVADGVRARCEHDTCLAYSPLCDDVMLGTCNAEGSGLDLAEPQTDCSEQGLDCSRAGCGDVTVDRVGFPSQTGVDVSTVTYWMVGNFYEVTSTTTLVEFRPDLDLEDWELRWHIYRSETREGPYTSTQNIREVAGGPNAALIETVPYFNFQLEAGYYYFLGVEAVDRTLPAIVRYDDTVAIANVSFGTVLGGYFGPQESSLEFSPSSYLATQELTTAILAP